MTLLPDRIPVATWYNRLNRWWDVFEISVTSTSARRRALAANRPPNLDPMTTTSLPQFLAKGNSFSNSWGVTWRRYSAYSARLVPQEEVEHVLAEELGHQPERFPSQRMAEAEASGQRPDPHGPARSVSVSDQRSSSAISGSSSPCSIPDRPAFSITANARYGLAAESTDRNSIRALVPQACTSAPGSSADRLDVPQQMRTPASIPARHVCRSSPTGSL